MITSSYIIQWAWRMISPPKINSDVLHVAFGDFRIIILKKNSLIQLEIVNINPDGSGYFETKTKILTYGTDFLI